MPTLIERRIDELERQQTATEPVTLIILRAIVTPGQLDAPNVRAEGHGHTFLREQGETEEQFEERVKADLQRLVPGLACYMACLFSDACETLAS